MITVRGLPILVDEISILETIRERVFLQQNREILRKIKRSGNNIMVCCPIHNNGQERKPSCGISTIERKGHPVGTWNCFSCGERGTFELFVAKCFGYDEPAWGQKWLIDNFVTGETYERPDIPTIVRPNILNRIKAKINYVSEEELASYRFYHPYMWQRKLTPEIVEKYDVGYQKDFVVFEDPETGYKQTDEVLTFPCRDINGKCLFVSRRSIRGKSFYLPQDIEKPVYGIYELDKNCNDVVICESVINALTCAAYGINAVALFGTGDEFQYSQLNRLSCRHFILGLDPDKAGAKGSYKLKHALKGKIITKLLLPFNKDINDLSKEEFFNLKEIYI